MKNKLFFIYFFHCVYTKIFWVDVENFITRKLNTAVKLGGSEIMIYVDDYGIEKDKVYIIQLLIIMGKFHIHKMKWSGGKTIFFYFINEFKQYCNTIYKCRQVNCTIFIICFNYYVWQWQQVCDQIGAFTTSIRAPNITTR